MVQPAAIAVPRGQLRAALAPQIAPRDGSRVPDAQHILREVLSASRRHMPGEMVAHQFCCEQFSTKVLSGPDSPTFLPLLKAMTVAACPPLLHCLPVWKQLQSK